MFFLLVGVCKTSTRLELLRLFIFASSFIFGIGPKTKACSASDFGTTHSSLNKIEKTPSLPNPARWSTALRVSYAK